MLRLILIFKSSDIENIADSTVQLTEEEQYCEDYFANTISRDISGKFVVKIPLKCDPIMLGNSKDSALQRLFLQEKRLNHNVTLKEKYKNFISKYLELRHAAINSQ